MESRKWLFYALMTTITWGIWGAFIDSPAQAGFPATLGFAVWALTTIPVALWGMRAAKWGLDYDRRAIFLGSMVGFLGAGGQLILFEALRLQPAYIVFPVISLYPMLTVVLSVVVLKEKGGLRAWTGIGIAAPALVLLSYQPPTSQASTSGWLWLILCLLVFAMWGVQAYIMKLANRTMRAESIFFYMSATALVMIPLAVWMTDMSQPINWGLNGAWEAAGVQVLNSIGALTLVYAMRYGKAMIVAPMTAMAPVLTIIISLVLYQTVPGPVLVVGMILASISIYLMAE